ncbi:hypothetical protein NIES4075_38740 [Tolypothrix sp. NIES-4075]|nr:hypothetical protein NIES4075_38740 [Tolypothrix sp. NIES-4075]
MFKIVEISNAKFQMLTTNAGTYPGITTVYNLSSFSKIRQLSMHSRAYQGISIKQ